MASPSRPLPPLDELRSAPDNPHSGTPPRAPLSVRRTSHLNMTWPDGPERDMRIDAAARDLVTGGDGRARVAASAELRVSVDRTRVLTSLSSMPGDDRLRELVGQGGGSGYRARLQALVPEELATGTPLYFLLDDLPGVTLVGPVAWRLWPAFAEAMPSRPRHRAPSGMRDICSGFRSDGLPIQRMMNGDDPRQNLVPGSDLAQPGDPIAWHAIQPPPAGSAMLRRRRRIDVTAGQELTVDSVFRDSMWSPEGVETVVHEYGVHATVDPRSMRLTGVQADPRVLPFMTCPAAARNVDLLLGEPMRTLRRRVLELVIGTDGCTHLNDALRALAEVPVLAEELAAASGLA